MLRVSRALPLAAALAWLPFASAQSVPAPAAATNVSTGFLDKTITIAGRDHRYVVYVPPGYATARDQRWPLLVFLNGMGECGTDGKKQIEVGLAPAIGKQPERWPFVVVFPQKPDKESQWIDHEALVMGTLAATEQEYRIDAGRRLLTGLSQGGAGTWALGAKHADVFAAIAPVCGYGKPDAVAAALTKMPIWAFHGLDDKVVPPQQSKDLCAGVEKAGGKPVLTLYEKTAHNSWDQAYRESALAEWLRLAGASAEWAACIADPVRMQSGSIEIVVQRWADTTPGPGSDRVAMEWGGDRLQWHRRSSAPPDPEQVRSGEVAGASGRSAFASQLVRLARSGLFDTPEQIRPAPAPGVPVTGASYVIHASIDGGAGPIRFRREFPDDAQWDPAFAGVVRALQAAVDDVKSRR